MNKKKIIDIIIRTYKLTLLFPKKEPLRYKIRETASQILENAVSIEVFHSHNLNSSNDLTAVENFYFDFEKDLEILKSYLEVAKWQNWVSYFDVLEIEQDYDKIKEEFIFSINQGVSNPDKGATEAPIILSDLRDSSLPLVCQDHNLRKVMEKNKESMILNGNEGTENSSESKGLDVRKEKILEFLKEKGKAQVWEVSKIFSEVSKRTLRRDFVQLLELGLIERIGQSNETFYKLKRE